MTVGLGCEKGPTYQGSPGLYHLGDRALDTSGTWVEAVWGEVWGGVQFSVFFSSTTPSFSSPCDCQLVNSFLEKASEKVLDSASSDFTR